MINIKQNFFVFYFAYGYRLLVFGVDCMNILFEIADRDLMIIGAILVVVLVVALIIFKAVMKKNKVMPISDDVRFDNEENGEEEIKEEIKPAELTEEQKQAKAELERVYEQMSADLEKQEEKHDDIDAFEREQEENAIISYQELMAAAEKLKQEANGYEAHVEDKADMRVNEAMNTYKEHTEKAIKKQEEKPAYHGFKNSEIISPIYGIQRENSGEKSSPKPQRNGIIGRAYEEVNPESENEKNVDFLNSLKEFRKNL